MSRLCDNCMYRGSRRAYRNRLKVYCKQLKRFVFPENAEECEIFVKENVDDFFTE